MGIFRSRLLLAARKLVNVNIVWGVLSFIVFKFSWRYDDLTISIFILLFLFIFTPIYLFWLERIILKSIFIFCELKYKL